MSWIAIAAIGLSGCIHYYPAAVSSASLGPKEHPIAVVSDRSNAYYIGPFGPLGNDSLLRAIEEAKSQRKCDTIINMAVDRYTFCFPFDGLCFIRRVTTEVYGTLIQYDDPWTKENVIPQINIEPNPSDGNYNYIAPLPSQKSSSSTDVM